MIQNPKWKWVNNIKPKEIDVREENDIGLHAIKRSIPRSIIESLPEAQNQAQQIVCSKKAEFSKVSKQRYGLGSKRLQRDRNRNQ